MEIHALNVPLTAPHARMLTTARDVMVDTMSMEDHALPAPTFPTASFVGVRTHVIRVILDIMWIVVMDPVSHVFKIVISAFRVLFVFNVLMATVLMLSTTHALLTLPMLPFKHLTLQMEISSSKPARVDTMSTVLKRLVMLVLAVVQLALRHPAVCGAVHALRGRAL
jgi:hypothetical protein